jgi:hypothetical protein
VTTLDHERQEETNQTCSVKTAAAQLESARHEVDVANLGAGLAREEWCARPFCRRRTNLEGHRAQDANRSRASDKQIQALYRYNQARADLARATGQMQNLYSR